MSQSGRPAAAAVVAAPILKEWLANAVASCPAEASRVRRCSVRDWRVRYEPSAKVKSGPF